MNTKTNTSLTTRTLDILCSHGSAMSVIALVIVSMLLRLWLPRLSIISEFSIGILAVIMTVTVIWHWQRLVKQPGMLVFHISLAAVLAALLIAPLYRVNAYFELAEGQTFQGEFILYEAGSWHVVDKHRWHLTQGTIQVNYKRDDLGKSINSVLNDEQNNSQKPIRFLQPVNIDGFRITPTGNMGYSAILTYSYKDGRQQHGVVNFPGYPTSRTNQTNRFLSPETQETHVRLNLVNPPYRKDQPWSLDLSENTTVTIEHDWLKFNLKPGDVGTLPNGRLHFNKLVRWLGYSAVYDPFAPFIFFSALVSLLAIFWHVFKMSFKSKNNITATDAI